ncbi:S-methyl-5-thioribose-1-phosphate isomerase [Plantactinospora sp. KBS50]|uniref:S-methyl-5-thioribose-1-phosphate isomerase n=1 Tax=Plantactinospora sp. KBS50 TaxID=2024580 RepID=UPI000BAADE36|nr:S-methyl-5-thioribose-1-phosphate isomerase [Plantactinospora sp. KBS50]ASW57771.1 S-methyl-5-thioribose-1-phosphate isomerase [Plantactinospora sp. KBS50]
MRTIDWQDGLIVAIDQTRLPHEVEFLRIRTIEDLVTAIRSLAIRGAPALGAAGALGVALAARLHPDDPAELGRAAAAVRAARPTAVNLAWGVDRVRARVEADGPAAALDEALAVLAEDVRCCRALSERGARWLVETVGPRLAVQTHCNAGALATVEWGTALGVVRSLREQGALTHVYASETRPLLQGARLTVWELAQLGVPHTLVVDSAAASVLAQGLVGAVVVGADRIAANGDVVNKVGTYPLALAAARAGVPMVVAAPESTVDLATPSGRDVHIEVRAPQEITVLGAAALAPAGTGTLNYAFDITPADLVTAIVTERRIILPAAGGRPDDDAGPA